MVNIFLMSLGIIFIVVVYKKVKNKIFSEKESIFWILNSILILVLSFFPKIIDKISFYLGINYPPSLLFLLGILFLMLVIFRQTQQLSVINERVKELAQREALTNERVSKLIEKLDENTKI